MTIDLQKLSDEEIVTRLATDVMGWEKQKDGRWQDREGIPLFVTWQNTAVFFTLPLWNPLVSWDAWRQVEEKLMEDEEMFAQFVVNVIGHTTFSWNAVLEYQKADLRTRALAVLHAKDSHSSYG